MLYLFFPLVSTCVFRVIKIGWVADGKKDSLRLDLLRLPTDAVTKFDVIYEHLLQNLHSLTRSLDGEESRSSQCPEEVQYCR